MLGKRKRSSIVVSRRNRLKSDTDPPNTESHDVFRQLFESNFEPLADLSLPTQSVERQEDELSGDEDQEESEWDGISDAETTVNAVEVIEYVTEDDKKDEVLHGVEVKTFMTSRPPGAKLPLAKASGQPQTADDEMDDVNLKNDLDLQRLLQESSLLKKEQEGNKADRNRKTDLRLQALGLKSSMYKQEKMPMAHRQGMKAKAHFRDEARRKDARENGVILEKVSKTARGDKVKRERGVDAPGVGRFRGGTLKLSKRDVSDIQQGPKQTFRGGRRR